jgi:hypothetical protein
MLFSSKTSQTSQIRSADAACPNRRCSTTISMLEEEFGMREPPKATTRFGAAALFFSHPLSKSYSLSVALPPKLRILPPKRKYSTTQAPEPRRSSSFSKGPWETLWGCDSDLESVESPLQVDFPLESFPDYHPEQGSVFDEDVATPTNGTSWTSDEELTPLFSSNFPSTQDPNALRCEDHSMMESFGQCLNFHRA